MKFQLCMCKKHFFLHGNFFDETGPWIKEVGGLIHLSGDMFCQTDALAFIQESLNSEKITLEEACALGRDQALLSLPEERPSNLELYQKNEKKRVENLVTKEGKRQMLFMKEPQYSLKRFMAWLERQW